MGRHSLPDGRRTGAADPPPRGGVRTVAAGRRRTVALTTALVLSLAAGTAVAVRAGFGPFGGSCSDDAVRLDVVAAPAVAPALRAAAGHVRERDVTSDGHCMDIRVAAREPYKVADELRREESEPAYDVWVPDSALWIQRADPGDGSTQVSPAGTVASSPIGVGMVKSAADALGWPRKTYTWAQLAGAATGGDELRLGAADPARSASGLLALTRLGTSPTDPDASNSPDPGSSEPGSSRPGSSDSGSGSGGPDAPGSDSDSSGSDARGSERTGTDAQEPNTPDPGSHDAGIRAAATAKTLAHRTADSDSRLLDTLPHDSSGAERGNPRRNQALILSEQASFTHNASGDGERSLDLFYPKDGSPALDFPYTLIRERDLSTDESRAALRFMTLFSDDVGRCILHRYGFRTEGTQPSAALVTAAGGRSPQPYRRDAADPPSDKEVQETLGMWTITVRSARFITVVDASDSMRQLVPGRGESRMDITKSALLQALTGFTDDDEIGLWEFATRLDGDRDHRELVPTGRLGDRADRSEGGGTHRDRLVEAFRGLQPVPGGATGLYDTTLAAYEKAREGYAAGRFNTLVLLTDGVNQDPDSISRGELVSRLRALADPRKPLPVIAIAVGPDADEREADQIARATGGSGHEVDDPAQIHSVILKAITQAGTPQ
ncbi:VWA domain-containing protein [Streptomyces sp. p1417]|uniref:VWA domain-containing protein n=1 Tax=Streptomyces typhae TaxID=2681492 RepID=A0A6L6X3G3_9ACTN|nr:substrate-binding domain-containing protein [Streptomyces typhae]MVO88236.1 VWA domain-containing protein [Streptomyces typhae]